ncbi:MAG: hypothetical protein V4530_15735 [Pseudomonadota bacterium]
MTLSRSAIALAALLGAAPVHADIAIDRYRSVTSVEPHCGKPSDGREILVCGARRADRWRVPYVGYDAGDPRGESVSDERNRLASEPKLKCGQTAFATGCGMVGVSVGTNFTADSLRLRPLAP